VGFRTDAIIFFNNIPRLTTYISSTELRADIQATDVDEVGSFNVRVENPSPGCGESNSLPFEVEEPIVPTAGLRFVVSEDNWIVPGNETQFRVQEAGSDDAYRMFLSIGNGDFVSQITPRRYRFSPDATKLAILFEESGVDPDPIYRAKVFDLGGTLTSAGDWGDFDGEPQPDVFILDAPLINEALLHTGDLTGSIGGWLEISVNNNGDLAMLEADYTPAEVKPTMTWAFTQDVTESGTPTGKGNIVVVADHRAAANTSVGTIRVQKCCDPACGGGDLTVTATPGAAWWSPSGSPASGSCLSHAVSPLFCHLPGETGAFSVCNADKQASVEFTITVDKTGLAQNTYTDLGVFDFDSGAECYGALCLEVEGPEGEVNSGQAGTLPVSGAVVPGSLILVVDEPSVRTIRLKTKAVGGVIITQSTLDGSTSLSTQIGDTLLDTWSGILDSTNNLVASAWQDPAAPPEGPGGEDLIAITDIAEFGGLPRNLFTAFADVVNVGLIDVPTIHPMGVASHAGFTNYTGLGIQFGDATLTDLFTWVLLWDGDNATIYKFTNDYYLDIFPLLISNFGVIFTRPLLVFKDATSGYAVAPWYDTTVRQFTISGETLTLEDLPGTLLVTPGAADPATVRALAPYDNNDIGSRTPEIEAIGYGGIPVAAQ